MSLKPTLTPPSYPELVVGPLQSEGSRIARETGSSVRQLSKRARAA